MDADDPGNEKVKQADKQSDVEPFDVAQNDNNERRSDPKKLNQEPTPPHPVDGIVAAGVIPIFFAGQ
jgi:hypothetical protein